MKLPPSHLRVLPPNAPAPDPLDQVEAFSAHLESLAEPLVKGITQGIEVIEKMDDPEVRRFTAMAVKPIVTRLVDALDALAGPLTEAEKRLTRLEKE